MYVIGGRDDCGSSPRGRGKRTRHVRALSEEGLIPARAGKTGGHQNGGSQTGAHPRAGGENPTAYRGNAANAGSSPRGRGKLNANFAELKEAGLIPARAGKTRSAAEWCLRRAAHPRAGGENSRPRDDTQCRSGSSPRGRGKLRCCERLRIKYGLIPARAGKTWPHRPALTALSAHPRAGGENPPRPSNTSPAPGSSPRGRGKPTAHTLWLLIPGLIPARAGKTNVLHGRCLQGWAHPRAGGENQANGDTGGGELGSSPRGRGKLPSVRLQKRTPRLIPARAGKTQ